MTTVEREDAGTAARQVLSVTLMNGDRLEADLGDDAEASRAELASVHKRLATESFVRLGEYTIVRSEDVRCIQLHSDDDSQHGIIDMVKEKLGGGHGMTSYETEQNERTTEEYGRRGTGTRVSPRRHQRSEGPGFADQFLGYGRRPYTETKPFFLTSEFLAFVFLVAGVLIASAVTDSLDAPRAWLIAGIVTAAYIVSRGLAKAGTRDPNPTLRDWDWER
jgi:hypothetical protein